MLKRMNKGGKMRGKGKKKKWKNEEGKRKGWMASEEQVPGCAPSALPNMGVLINSSMRSILLT